MAAFCLESTTTTQALLQPKQRKIRVQVPMHNHMCSDPKPTKKLCTFRQPRATQHHHGWAITRPTTMIRRLQPRQHQRTTETSPDSNKLERSLILKFVILLIICKHFKRRQIAGSTVSGLANYKNSTRNVASNS